MFGKAAMIAVLLAPTASIARHEDHRTKAVRWLNVAASSAQHRADATQATAPRAFVFELPLDLARSALSDLSLGTLKVALQLLRQRLSARLRQERRRHESEDINHRDHDRGLAESAKIRDQPARDQWTDPCNQAGRVEHERRCGRAHARRKEFRQPCRHPGVL